jgi:hypothetical protein
VRGRAIPQATCCYFPTSLVTGEEGKLPRLPVVRTIPRLLVGRSPKIPVIIDEERMLSPSYVPTSLVSGVGRKCISYLLMMLINIKKYVTFDPL